MVQLSDACVIPERFLDRTECEMVDVTEDGVRFKSYPKHATEQQETELITWQWFEQVAAEDAPRL